MRRGVLLLAAVTMLAGIPHRSVAADRVKEWLAGIPLDQAVRVGTGRQVVVEVSDPDCRFSRRMARYWEMRKDVSRYVFLVALKNHPDAPEKAEYILCAADRAAAYREVFGGGLDFDEKKPARGCDGQGLLERHRQVAARLGASGTPTYVINGNKVEGARVGEIERLLGGERIPFDASDPD